MWIINKDGFLSIVQHNKNPKLLMIRARVRDDLVEAFPEQVDDIVETIDGDYRYRVTLSRELVQEYMCQSLDDLTYTSHAKEEMADGKPGRLNKYMSIWSTLSDLQPGGPYNSRATKRIASSSSFDDFDDFDNFDPGDGLHLEEFKAGVEVVAAEYDAERGIELVRIAGQLVDILAVEDDVVCGTCGSPVVLNPNCDGWNHVIEEDDDDHNPMAILECSVEIEESWIHTGDRPQAYEDVKRSFTGIASIGQRKKNTLGDKLAGAIETVKENVKDD